MPFMNSVYYPRVQFLSIGIAPTLPILLYISFAPKVMAKA